MKILLENTDLFDDELVDKILVALGPELKDWDISMRCRLSFKFNEGLINYYEMKNFIIPNDRLPKYDRGKNLTGEDKIYAVLKCQLNIVEEQIESFGIKICYSEICGSPYINIDNISIEIHEEELKNPDGKKSPSGKVSNIMPSETSFIENANNAAISLNKTIDSYLIKAFGDKDMYLKYLLLSDKMKLYKVYTDFKNQYGDNWTSSKAYIDMLRDKFIDTVKVECRIIEKPEEVKKIRKPIKIPEKIIFEIPISKKTKSSTQNKIIGYIKILTDGTIVKAKCSGNFNNSDSISIELEELYFKASEKLTNSILKNEMTKLIDNIGAGCNKYGYVLNLDIFNNTFIYLDLKSIMRNARKI